MASPKSLVVVFVSTAVTVFVALIVASMFSLDANVIKQTWKTMTSETFSIYAALSVALGAVAVLIYLLVHERLARRQRIGFPVVMK